MRCSAPLPLVVIAKRGAAAARSTVRNMLRVVPVPKSKSREQAVIAAGFTHTAIVKSRGR